eukprot:TRINITY_DN18134_c0_g2_i1.p1 TRINITY_DN18134_c0_g2~~TRINITY_DN18134_c0_g2_i1.p1  ORF type:complete len:252 (-),score=38.91 TRINITY_DN18134_c0_g2_i1:112-867(-)
MSTSPLDLLHAALLEKGICRLVFVRHANAARPDLPLPGEDKGMLGGMDAYATPHDWKRDDQKRPITEKGFVQAQYARAWFYGEPMKISEAKTVMIASGARRATETCQVMAETIRSLSIALCPSLHPAGIAPELEAMFATIGYGAIEKYVNTAEGAKATEEYAKLVSSELASLVSGLNGQDTLAIFGHAVFLNAVALYLVGGVPSQVPANGPLWIKLSDEEIVRLTQTDLGEAQGLYFESGVDGGRFLHLQA